MEQLAVQILDFDELNMVKIGYGGMVLGSS